MHTFCGVCGESFSGYGQLNTDHKTACPSCFDGHKCEPIVRTTFRNEVEISSVGVCMFCSRPDANMAFIGDDTVRICTRCVK